MDASTERTRADYIREIDPEMTAAVKWITEQSVDDNRSEIGESE